VDYRELHADSLVIDTHNDTIVAHIRRGNRSLERGDIGREDRHSGTIAFTRGDEAPRPGADFIQIDYPQMRAGGIDAGFFAVDVTLAFQNHLAYALDGIGYLLHDLETSAAAADVVLTAGDLLAARSAGRLGILLAIEHADCTERSLNVLRVLHRIGVRSIGLTHNVSSWAADGCFEQRPGVGLTAYGAKLVKEMNHLGMLVDLAHVSESAFFSALEVSERPVIFSHGNAGALCDHPRNLTDEQLVALCKRGGVIGLSYVRDFVDAAGPSIERLLDHVDHIATMAGVEAIALGGDFDGGGTLLANATQAPLITKGLVERGYGEQAIRGILGLNALRVLQAAIG
jgi:membrane dipeptidase